MKRTILVARHEAGHAVMAQLCGHHVVRVRITKRGGSCEHYSLLQKVDPLHCGHDFQEVFRKEPPPDLARLAFLTPSEMQAEFSNAMRITR